MTSNPVNNCIVYLSLERGLGYKLAVFMLNIGLDLEMIHSMFFCSIDWYSMCFILAQPNFSGNR